VIRTLGQVEATTGRWDDGLAHIRQAALLDPRSPPTADRLSRALLWLRRYSEARAASERGLAASADNLALIEGRAMSHAGEGDLPAARASLHDVTPNLDRSALMAYVTNYWDAFWMLDSADIALSESLPPSAYDGDRGVWGVVHAELFWQQGDSTRARAYADSAMGSLNHSLRENSHNWQSMLFRGLMLAMEGKRGEATRDRDRGLALAQETKDHWSSIPYANHVAARIDVALGDRDAAIALLSTVLQNPYVISPAWLRIDPTWNRLRGDARFERLAHGDGR
jgi:tetratricopeptide (TPR) repeat protein